jgi:hypothetical protein
MERSNFRNDYDTIPERSISTSDVPHRVALSYIANLPFGKGRYFGRNWHGFVNGVLGGWQTQAIFQAQSGRPIAFGDVVYFGDPSKLTTHITSKTLNNAFDTSLFLNNTLNSAYDVHYFPYTLSGFRGQGTNNWDMSILKVFNVTERIKLQVRGEFLNAFNHVLFANPNVTPGNSAFGTVTSQYNLPREVQLGMRATF